MNLIVWPSLFDEYRREILGFRLLMVQGHLQIEKGVTHVIVQRCFNLHALLAGLTPAQDGDLPLLTLSRADERDGTPFPEEMKKKAIGGAGQETFIPEGRNFK